MFAPQYELWQSYARLDDARCALGILEVLVPLFEQLCLSQDAGSPPSCLAFPKSNNARVYQVTDLAVFVLRPCAMYTEHQLQQTLQVSVIYELVTFVELTEVQRDLLFIANKGRLQWRDIVIA